MEIPSLKLTACPWKYGITKKKPDCLPSIHFSGVNSLLVSGRVNGNNGNMVFYILGFRYVTSWRGVLIIISTVFVLHASRVHWHDDCWKIKFFFHRRYISTNLWLVFHPKQRLKQSNIQGSFRCSLVTVCLEESSVHLWTNPSEFKFPLKMLTEILIVKSPFSGFMQNFGGVSRTCAHKSY